MRGKTRPPLGEHGTSPRTRQVARARQASYNRALKAELRAELRSVNRAIAELEAKREELTRRIHEL